MKIINELIELSTGEGVDIHDISDLIRDCVDRHRVRDGMVVVTSRHTTTALTINEYEERLLADIRNFFGERVPAERHWLHNDIARRDCPPDEPENARSHIVAMLLGGCETLPLVDGELQLGSWQSVLFVELDGPRERNISLQIWSA